ncbi:MAG: class A beta-lactamase [Xanthomonadaceae bacterium]|nr:class A beta-lactamase [Xanthomonadaceae bacterium]
MGDPVNRRDLLKNTLLGASALILRPAPAPATNVDGAAARLAALERRHGGRLGVSILDTGNGRRVAHRGDERFLMCSTFKLLAVAAVLARVDRGAERLDRRIVFGREAVLGYAPVTRHRVGAPGMSVAGLCRAAITLSDNTAANLLLGSLGGPAGVTAFVRRLGDTVTRLDRIEPELNVGSPGDLRDTTSPDAMLASMQKVLLGDVLATASREQLLAWLRACRTGTDELRAGVPAGWVVGDKTGSGARNETNDVAILMPPQRKPLLVTAYYAGSSADTAARDAVLAEAGRIAASI